MSKEKEKKKGGAFLPDEQIDGICKQVSKMEATINDLQNAASKKDAGADGNQRDFPKLASEARKMKDMILSWTMAGEEPGDDVKEVLRGLSALADELEGDAKTEADDDEICISFTGMSTMGLRDEADRITNFIMSLFDIIMEAGDHGNLFESTLPSLCWEGEREIDDLKNIIVELVKRIPRTAAARV